MWSVTRSNFSTPDRNGENSATKENQNYEPPTKCSTQQYNDMIT